MRDIKIIEVTSELGAGTRGASLGIDALKKAAINRKSDFFAQYPSESIPTENHLLKTNTTTPTAIHISGISTMYQRIADTIAQTVKQNKFPLVLAGDHSNAGGTIAGLKMANPEHRIGVVWIDAHADLHTPYTSPSGNVHGMPLATAINTDNLDKRNEENEPTEEAIQYWEQMKNLGGIAPKINAEDIVFIALRDTEEEEDYLIDQNSIKVYKVENVRDNGPESIVSSTMKHLAHCDSIYVSFDVDSIDMGISTGTGTPVKDGITELEAEQLLTGFLKEDKLCCLEITEVNPTLDKTKNKMAEVTFDILRNSINATK